MVVSTWMGDRPKYGDEKRPFFGEKAAIFIFSLMKSDKGQWRKRKVQKIFGKEKKNFFNFRFLSDLGLEPAKQRKSLI